MSHSTCHRGSLPFTKEHRRASACPPLAPASLYALLKASLATPNPGSLYFFPVSLAQVINTIYFASSGNEHYSDPPVLFLVFIPSGGYKPYEERNFVLVTASSQASRIAANSAKTPHLFLLRE